MLLASDLTFTEGPDKKISQILSIGVSKSSMAGDKSYALSGMLWSNLKQFALSPGFTKMNFDKGALNTINSYGLSMAYLMGNWMVLASFTDIKPHPKYGTYGFNTGVITLLLKNPDGGVKVNLASSAVVFWTKPFQYNKKLTVSPQVFVMGSPASYIPADNTLTYNKQLGFLLGSSFDYKISKRFGFSINYKANVNTQPGTPVLHNILVGSRMIL